MSANIPDGRKLEIFRKFSETLSEEQIQFISKTPELLSPEYMTMLYQAGRAVTMTAPLSQPGSRTRVRAPIQKHRKVVNKFIGFRTYYSPLLKGLPQKQRSPILSAMWRADQNHNLWELLSTTFSDIRNASDEAVSFERYLRLAVEIVPVIPVHEYFQKMGMSLVDNELKHDVNTVMEAPESTSVSSGEIVSHCHRKGLMKNLPKKQQPVGKAVIPFTVAAQPAFNAKRRLNPQMSDADYDFSEFTNDEYASVSPVPSTPVHSFQTQTPDSATSPMVINESAETAAQQAADLGFDEVFDLPFDLYNYDYEVEGYFPA